MSAGTGTPSDAIVLAGGRSRRMGSDKAAIELGEQRLVDRVVAAARAAGTNRVIVAGPAHTGTLADAMVREDPPFSGPVAALGAALPEVRASWVLVLACDLVYPDRVARQLADLRRSISESYDGAILIDETGHRQWLAACYRTDRLRDALGAFSGDPDTARPLENVSFRSALATLKLREIPAEAGSTADIDTPEQLESARLATRARAKTHQQGEAP